MALETGGFQVRRLPDFQPMDPRLFVEQPIQLGDIAREGLEGFNRGRQMAAEDEVRESRLALEEARLAQLEQQMAQQEESAPIERRAAGARAVGAGAQARLRQLQVEEAERQQAMAEESRRTISEILEEGSGEDFEGFDDPQKEIIYQSARLGQIFDGTEGVPSREAFIRGVQQFQEQQTPTTQPGYPTAEEAQEALRKLDVDGTVRQQSDGRFHVTFRVEEPKKLEGRIVERKELEEISRDFGFNAIPLDDGRYRLENVRQKPATDAFQDFMRQAISGRQMEPGEGRSETPARPPRENTLDDAIDRQFGR